MPLISFWKSNPAAVRELKIEQVVAAAGDGVLADASLCSTEIREYFSQVSSEKLADYAEQCMSAKFDRSGFVLQDIVNELGRRLDYKVENGRYQGIVNAVGSDGLWEAPEETFLVAEVKTSDAYRVSLDRISEYSKKLMQQKSMGQKPSVVIVVGRQDTGELEAQIRGSRHAWDMRLVSVEALCKLVKLKESSDDDETGKKIRSILMPLEYTRIDALVDVMFTTAKEAVEENIDIEDVGQDALGAPISGLKTNGEKAAGQWQFTDIYSLQDKRESILQAIENRVGNSLVKKSRALYWDASHEIRISCTISKVYDKRGGNKYWYAFHPQWGDFLEEGREAYLALGCMGLDTAFLIPYKTIDELLPRLNTTTTPEGRTYWHIHISKSGEEFEIITAKSGPPLILSPYALPITKAKLSEGLAPR